MSKLTQDLDFSGRRVLVTGAANGFGEAIAELFAAHGATLVLADREADALSEVAARLGATAHVYDQSDIASIDALAATAGDIDVLINNAGILIAKPLLETSIEEIRQLVDVDFVGGVRLIQLIGRGMVERRRGVVLSIGSQTAFCGGENRSILCRQQGSHFASHAIRFRRVGTVRRARSMPRAGPLHHANDTGNGEPRIHGRSRPVARAPRSMGHDSRDRKDGTISDVRRCILRYRRNSHR